MCEDDVPSCVEFVILNTRIKHWLPICFGPGKTVPISSNEQSPQLCVRQSPLVTTVILVFTQLSLHSGGSVHHLISSALRLYHSHWSQGTSFLSAPREGSPLKFMMQVPFSLAPSSNPVNQGPLGLAVGYGLTSSLARLLG